MRRELWTPAEDALVRKIYPDYPRLGELLPQRTDFAIRSRAATLGVRKKRRQWTTPEMKSLRKMYEGGATKHEILAAFPHSNWTNIKGIVNWYGFHRKDRRFKLTGIPVIDMIRERAEAMNLSMIDVDAMAKTKCYFQRSGWQTSSLNGKYILRAIIALAGSPSVIWEPLTED